MQGLEQCRRTAKGFLQLAHSSLAALLFLTDDKGVCSAFASHPSRLAEDAVKLAIKDYQSKQEERDAVAKAAAAE